MYLLALGLNHQSAPLRIRERAAVTAEHLDDALKDLAARDTVDEATIISTCNRTEIYCRQETEDDRRLQQWLCEFHDLAPGDLDPYLYRHPNADAVRHAFRVASGLDSMVLGEPQILGQMKQAFAVAHRMGATGKILNRLFQQTFAVAKQVRTDTAIGASAVSVAFAAVSLAKRIFTDLSQQTVLLIGAGETIELTAQHLRENGARHVIVANRTLERAQRLASVFAGEAIALDEIPTRLRDGDIVISSTASTLPLLGKGAVEQALRERRHRPMFMVDLAVPRDIEPQVADLRDVYLYTVDDLKEIISENVQSRQAAAVDAEKIIDAQTDTFMQWLNGLDAVPTILALRRNVDEMTQAELARAQKRLRAGDDPEQVLKNFARSLAQKFTHPPSSELRKLDSETDLMNAARRLFNLDDPDSRN